MKILFAGLAVILSSLIVINSPGRAEEPLLVFAGIPPMGFLAEQIGGDAVRTEVLLRPGADPHSFEPTPRQVRQLAQASLFLKAGMPFEEQLIKKIRATKTQLFIVDVSAGIKKLPVDPSHCSDASHKHGEEELPEDEQDSHVWLSPKLLKLQAKNVFEAFSKASPQRQEAFRRNYEKLAERIDKLDAEITERLKPYAGRGFLVFHPAFAYFADCYGLRQVAVEAGGKQPTARQLRELTALAKKENLRVLFVQPQFDPSTANKFAGAIQGRVEPLDDLAPNVLENLGRMAGTIAESYQPASGN